MSLIKTLGGILAGLALVLTTYLAGVNGRIEDNALGGATNGLPAVIASSTALTVGPDIAVTLWSTGASNGNCSSRVISTVGQPIMLSFGDRPNYPSGNRATTTVSATQGILQAASTTIAYDGGIYGCGTVAAYGFNASTTVNIVEFK